MNEIIEKLFSNEITENGLVELQKKYPKNLKRNMKNETEFKAARKTRTEMNKLVEKIDQRRKDASTELKDFGDSLISQVTDIYDVVVLPFKKENQFRTEEATKEKRKLEERLTKERAKIKEITTMLDDCINQTSEHISNIIEAVDLIETDIFHKDVIHEAIETKKETLQSLNQLLFDAKAREKLAVEREELAKKQKELDKSQKITDRINKLKSQPIDFIGKSSTEIKNQISKLRSFFITVEEFGEKKAEAEQISQTVITQLTQMLNQQLKVKQAEAITKHKTTVVRISKALGCHANHGQIQTSPDNLGRYNDYGQSTEEWLKDYSKAKEPARPAGIPARPTDWSKPLHDLPVRGDEGDGVGRGHRKSPYIVYEDASIEQVEHTLPGDIYEWSQRYEISLIAHEELIEILRSYKITC
jgi:hypothetical protein